MKPRRGRSICWDTGKADAYDAALTALREGTSERRLLARNPDELEEDQEPYRADAAGLPRFLEGETLPWYGCVGDKGGHPASTR